MLFVKSSVVLADNWVALFPGQGSIAPGAGEAWRTNRHWHVVDQVSESAKVDVEHLLLAAEHDLLVRTDNAQLATFALSLVAWFTLVDSGTLPLFLMGHSLGEFSALVAAGVLSVEDGSALIATRGTAMQKAASTNPGSMVALMGGDNESRQRLDTINDVWVANINGEGQIVVSGTPGGLEVLANTYRDLGFRRATPLPVGGAFHCPLMAPAQADLDAALARTSWHPTNHVVIANVDGQPHDSPTEWPGLLSRQLTSAVEFLRATSSLPASVTSSIEMPPGAVLTGLTKRIRPFDTQIAISTPTEAEGVSL